MEFTSLVAVKSKSGELTALRHVDRVAARRVQPLVEVLSNVASSGSVRESLGDVARVLKQHGRRLMLDASQLDPASSLWRTFGGPLDHVWRMFRDSLELHELGEIPPFVPVVRMDAADAYLRKTRGLLAELGCGVGVRIVGAQVRDPQVAAALERALRLLRVDITEVDLVVDVGFLRRNRLTPAVVRDVFANLGSLPIAGCRSVSLLGGSVPPRRWDAGCTRSRVEFDLWHQAFARFPSLRYADYGVTHAAARDGADVRSRARHPFLHYTRCQESRFLTRRLPPEGAVAQADDYLKRRYFGEIAEEVVEAERPVSCSWGDRSIRDSALHGGPADSSEWIAIGTSHHIAHLAADGDLLPEDRL
ncbi:beta family protein [Parasphingorhabdus pacifica]